MTRAFSISIFLHILFIAGVIYSTELSLLWLKQHKDQLLSPGPITVDLLYKATDTPMQLGKSEQNLPPPMVQPKAQEEPAPSAPAEPQEAAKKQVQKTKALSKAELEKKKKLDLKNILSQMRKEVKKDDDRPAPKDKNFPKSETGEKDSRGTGSRGARQATPAELALQSAMRRHFSMVDAENFRKRYPDARGYITIVVVGVGTQLQLNSMNISQSSGFPTLDQQCQLAIREALKEETFAPDIIQDLSNKEKFLTCEP